MTWYKSRWRKRLMCTVVGAVSLWGGAVATAWESQSLLTLPVQSTAAAGLQRVESIIQQQGGERAHPALGFVWLTDLYYLRRNIVVRAWFTVNEGQVIYLECATPASIGWHYKHAAQDVCAELRQIYEGPDY